MSHTRTTQTFKDERMSQDERIIRAIGEAGPRNIAKLARLTGVHPETIRYKIKKQLSKSGFRFQAEVDYAKLGLELHWVEFQVPFVQYDSAPKLFKCLNKTGYLVHYSKVLPQGYFMGLFVLPLGKATEFGRLLKSLREMKVVDGFRVSKVLAERHKQMDPGFFNFQAERWEVEWSRVRNSASVPLQAPRTVAEPEVDETDLLIIKELQKDALQHVTEIAGKVKVNPKTLEYHYREHVVGKQLVPRYMTRWMKDLTKTLAHTAIIERVAFRGLDPKEFARVQKTVNKVPYLWVEDLLADGTYVATLSAPAADFVEVGSYLNSELQYLGPKVEFGYLKVGDSMNYTVPHHMFGEGGWKFDLKSMEAAVSRELGSPQK